LVGTAYWRPLVAMLERMAVAGTIARADLELVLITDDLDAAMRHLRVHAIEQFGLHARREPRPSRWLGESGPAPPRHREV
ncbi:MAG TPA: hypothetical protein VNN79_13355, partial [Actinomycetota bacterium]|nr:hypothetical protein [Actinomycetota bacterium]